WVDNDDATQSFNVTIAPDALDEGNETVNLTLSGAIGAGLGAQSTATLTIHDSPGVLRFKSAPYTVNETTGTATITVERVNGRGGIVGVSYATSDGSAVAPGDYGG